MKGWLYRRINKTARWRQHGKEWTYSVVIPYIKAQDGKQFVCFDDTTWRAVIGMVRQLKDGTYKWVIHPHISLSAWWDFHHDFGIKQTLPQAQSYIEAGWINE